MKAKQPHLIERRSREQEKRRAVILNAARALFAKNGIESTSMGDIGKKARLSRSLLYEYFQDREEVYLAIVKDALGELSRAFVQAAQDQTTGLNRIVAIGWAYFEFAQNKKDYFNALMHFSALPLNTKRFPANTQPKKVFSEILEIANAVNELLCSQIVLGIEDKSIRANISNPMQVALSLWASTSGLIQTSFTKGPMFESTYNIGVRDLYAQGIDLLTKGIKS